MTPSRRLFVIAAAILLTAGPPSGADECLVKAVIGGEKAELKNCALAVYDEKGATIFFSESPIGAEERQMFELNSYPKDTDPSGRPRTMMHMAFCPGGGKSEARAAAVKSVELWMSSASSVMLGRQWVFELPKDAAVLKIAKLAGTLSPGGRLSGRITGGKTSDGLAYSWEADFDLAIPGKTAAAGPSCGD